MYSRELSKKSPSKVLSSAVLEIWRAEKIAFSACSMHLKGLRGDGMSFVNTRNEPLGMSYKPENLIGIGSGGGKFPIIRRDAPRTRVFLLALISEFSWRFFARFSETIDWRLLRRRPGTRLWNRLYVCRHARSFFDLSACNAPGEGGTKQCTIIPFLNQSFDSAKLAAVFIAITHPGQQEYYQEVFRMPGAKFFLAAA